MSLRPRPPAEGSPWERCRCRLSAATQHEERADSRIAAEVAEIVPMLVPTSQIGAALFALIADNGADVAVKDGDLGPVGWAAYQQNWGAVWLLMQRGAPWKNELALGTPVVDVLASDLRARRARHSEIPEEMEKILARYGVEAPRP